MTLKMGSYAYEIRINAYAIDLPANTAANPNTLAHIDMVM